MEVKKPPSLSGGEGGIRTLEGLMTLTRFPIVRARPGYATSPYRFWLTKRSNMGSIRNIAEKVKRKGKTREKEKGKIFRHKKAAAAAFYVYGSKEAVRSLKRQENGRDEPHLSRRSSFAQLRARMASGGREKRRQGNPCRLYLNELPRTLWLTGCNRRQNNR